LKTLPCRRGLRNVSVSIGREPVLEENAIDYVQYAVRSNVNISFNKPRTVYEHFSLQIRYYTFTNHCV